MTRREIDKAIQHYFDGMIGEDECRELQAVLKSDPSARVLYYEHACLHQALVYRFSRRTPIDRVKSLAAVRARFQRHRSARFAMLAAAAAFIVLGVVLRMIFLPEPPPMATMRSASGSLFTVEHSDPDDDPAPGELAGGSTVHLAQGALGVDLRDGSRAIVLAPATFAFHSEKRMFLHHGTAWFRVSEKGKGFQVATPEMIVTDLGTEFGVLSDPDLGDEVHVFSGRVIARSLGPRPAEESLAAGQARSCDPVGRLKTVASRPEDFLTKLPDHSLSELIANGDFEAGNTPPDQNYGPDGPDATAGLLPSWTFGSAVGVALNAGNGTLGLGNGITNIVSSTGDVQLGFLDNTNGPPAPGDSSLRQTFTTVPGTRYMVGFEMGGIFFLNRTMEVTASVYDGSATTGTALGQLAESRARAAGSGYNAPVSFTFTAASVQSILVFVETSANTNSANPAIDNVSVKALPACSASPGPSRSESQ